jgi:hypothetical protein
MNMIKAAVVSVGIALGMAAIAPPTAIGAQVRPTVHHTKTFVMPSGNIACHYDSGTIRCDIFSGLKPEPKKSCKYFWKGVVLNADGKAAFLCIIDTIYDPTAPVLKYGQEWRRGSIACTSKARGLRCHNDLGHGFFLSREQSRRW